MAGGDISSSTSTYKPIYGVAYAESEVTSITYRSVSDFVGLPLPKRGGYDFTEWKLGSCNTDFSTSSLSVKISLTAGWQYTNYKIEYDLDGGINNLSNPDSFTIENASVTLYSPTRNGYDFKGWFVSDTFTESVSSIETNVMKDVTLYAKWSMIRYTINYHCDEADLPDNPTEYYVTSESIKFNCLTKDNYYLAWYEDSDRTKLIDEIPSGSYQNYDLYAKWTPIEYTIDYHLNEGVNDAENPFSYNVESAEVTLKNATRNGYEFKGWYTNDNYEEKFVSIPKGSTGVVSVYARWSIVTYKITYHTYGAVNSSENPTEYNVNSEDIHLMDIENEELFFDGWYEDEDLTTSITTIPSGSYQNYDLYAKWISLFTKDGDYIYIGTYPQSKVTNDSVIAALNAEAGEFPTADDSRNWTSYGYYLNGSDSTDYMWYIDATYSDKRYRGVYFTSYRPYQSTKNSGYTNQKDNGYKTNTVYWFEYEPIKWRILSEENGESFLLCDMIIDSQEFYPSASTDIFEHNDGEGYGNNYALSQIRKWLNDDFYNTAFTDNEKKAILRTNVDNSMDSTGVYANNTVNPYVCNDTQDFVFLLSYMEARSQEYGLDTERARKKKPTEYAKSQGVYEDHYQFLGNYGCSNWWTRSPYYKSSNEVKYTYESGTISASGSDVNSSRGVLPAIKISFSSHVFGEWSKEIPATCEVGGYKKRVCETCGYYEMENLSLALGHDMIYHEEVLSCVDNCVDEYYSCTRCKKLFTDEKGENQTTLENLSHAALKHKLEYRGESSATCVSLGNKSHYFCARCEKLFVDKDGKNEIASEDVYISALGHDMVYHAEKKFCDEDGNVAYYNCLRCERYFTDEAGENELELQNITILALGHDLSYIKAVEPTCNFTGNSAYYQCNRCNKVFADRIGEIEAEAQNFIISALGHNMTYYKAKAAACSSTGNSEYYYCKRCKCYFTDEDGDNETTLSDLTTPMTAHEYEDGVCSVCGAIAQAYKRVDASNNVADDGKYILFGSYPQSEVKDSDILSALNSSVGDLPTKEEAGKWTSYEYFISENATDYMWYIDIEYSSEKYRGVYFTSYRPYFTLNSSSDNYSYQDENGYYTSMVYWFKYEPIKWRILYDSNGKVLVLSEFIIDAQDYCSPSKNASFEHNGDTGYANNYKLSNVRKWLNDTFYTTAFNTIEKDLILKTNVKNDSRSCLPYLDNDNDTNIFACSNTEDYVFLLSMQEATTTSYGFSSNIDVYDNARMKRVSDYAKSQNCYCFSASNDDEGFGTWYLRTPYYNDSTCVYISDTHGMLRNYAYVYSAGTGIVPALWLDVCLHKFGEWSQESVTCTRDGGKTRVCTKCGYKESVVDISALGHDMEYHAANDATCTSKGNFAHYYCSRCEKYFSDEDGNDEMTLDSLIKKKIPHNYEDGVCTVCGAIESIYIRVNSSDEEDEEGDYIIFGSYPQSEEKNSDIVSALNTMVGVLPTKESAAKWTSYGYFTSYRPMTASGIAATNYSYQDDNGYDTSTIYWFKYEPIKWKILSETDESIFIHCDMILDSQEYCTIQSDLVYEHNGGNGYPNNYELSNIRKWLNETFYNTAFTLLEKEMIQKTMVDNGIDSTADAENALSKSELYVCDNTEDHVFLLSQREVTTKEYGFNSSYNAYDTLRQRDVSDYAKSQGCYTVKKGDYVGNGYWWLRSPNRITGAREAYFVYYSGYSYSEFQEVNSTYVGVVPALKIKIC